MVGTSVKEILSEYYKDKIKESHPDYLVHGWESPQAVEERFSVLFQNVDLQGKCMLDVGCGVGTLFGEIRKRKISCEYLGIDLLPQMVALARQRQPQGSFLVTDLLEEQPFDEDCFDVVYASGIFNIYTGENEAFLVDMVEQMAKIASEAVVFNLLHQNSQDKEETYFYTNPLTVEKLLQGSRTFRRKPYKELKFIEGYLHNDFTVIMRL